MMPMFPPRALRGVAWRVKGDAETCVPLSFIPYCSAHRSHGLVQAKAAYSELERELKRTQDLLQSAQLLGRDKDTKLRAAQGELLAQVAAVRSSLMGAERRIQPRIARLAY